MRQRHLAPIALAAVLFASPLFAHSGDVIASHDLPGMIDVNDLSDLSEWTPMEVAHFMIDNGHPNTAEIWAQHKGDGIYIRAEISDGSSLNTDALRIYLDLGHDDGGSPDGNDWGITIQRNGIGRQGPATDLPNTWTVNVPPGNFEVSPMPSNPWIVELKIPTGVLSAEHSHELDLNTDGGRIGLLFQVFNASNPGNLVATYNQWPDDPMNLPIQGMPSAYGNYELDRDDTFPDLAVTDIRNNYDGSENYRKISKSQENILEVEISNPAGTSLGDAQDVRINLYLAARGIGESFHRLDQTGVLDSDCSTFGNADWPANDYTGVAKSQVCSGNTSHDDVGAQNPADIIANTADYTVKSNVVRVNGDGVTIAEGFNGWMHLMSWDTNNAQDNIYSTHDGVRLDHQCMKAEVISPNDPNKSNNTRQRNMDFVCLPAFQTMSFPFGIGSAGFMKYDPDEGKEMVLRLRTRNMDEGWGFELEGAEAIADGFWTATVRGTKSTQLQAVIDAPDVNVLGYPLKENLVVEPTAGGRHPRARIPSGTPPVFVKVSGGSQLVVSHFSFGHEEEQWVDLDGKKKLLGPNGPDGQSRPALDRFLEELGGERILLAPGSNLGALVGSFDGFRTSFTVGAGVVVEVPANATHLALAINGVMGLYGDNSGTGFRVKVTERRPGSRQAKASGFGLIAEAEAQEPAELVIQPLEAVVPTACVEGYERIDQQTVIGGQEHDLLRHIGDVCWGVINVYDRDRTETPDEGDPPPEGWDEGPWNGDRKGRRCGAGSGDRVAGAAFLALLGLTWVGRRAVRQRR